MATEVNNQCPECGSTKVEENEMEVFHGSHNGLTCAECGHICSGFNRN